MNPKLRRALLAFAAVTERNEGIPPTVREFIAEAGAPSANFAHYWFREMEIAGLIYTPVAIAKEGYAGSRSRQLTPAARALVEQWRREAT